MLLNVVPADPMDALQLAPRLRDGDKAEVRAMGHTPFNALMEAFDLPDAEVFSIIEVENEDDEEAVGEVIAMFGVSTSPDAPEHGVPWMLASPQLETYSKQFLRYCRTWVDRLQERYEVLYNLVHCQNTQGLRWLQWCGFEVQTKTKYGSGGEEFYLFTRERK